MRAGFSIIQSMEMVANEGPSPAAQEFERVITEVKLGLPLDQALDHLLARMPSEDLGLAVVAINVQRQVGGNLAEILMVIAKTVRERVRFQRDLRALTAQARYSSYIITGLPVAVAFVINLMDRPYESFLYTNPLGHVMIGAAVIMLGLGFFFLNRIANIEV
jgi:tight adherence protein B